MTSKVWNDDHRPEHVAAACRASLARLQLSYLDLYLVHWPAAWRKGTIGCPDHEVDLMDTWRAMELLVDQGLVRHIGVSNFGEQRLTRLLNEARILPRCNQIEIHLQHQQCDLVKFCQKNGIVVTAWSPLAKGGLVNDHPVVAAIAARRGISTSQLVLLWHFSRGVVAIPKSSNPEHIRDNLAVWKRAVARPSGGGGGDDERGGGVASDIQSGSLKKRNQGDGDSDKGRGAHALVSSGWNEDENSVLLSGVELDAIRELDSGKRLIFDFVGVFETTKWWPWHLVGSALCFLARIFWALCPFRIDLKFPRN